MMNREVKEVLTDLIDYYNTMGTPSDPGIDAFESVAQRASRLLERDSELKPVRAQRNSADIDPYAIDVVIKDDYYPKYSKKSEKK